MCVWVCVCVGVPSLYIFMYMYIQSPYTWKVRSGKTKVSWSYFFLNKKIQTLTMQVENVLREKRKALREREEAELKSLEVCLSLYVCIQIWYIPEYGEGTS